MSLPPEALVKDVWFAMWDVQTRARHDKVPGPLRDFGKTASRRFEEWFTHPGDLQTFAGEVLSGLTGLDVHQLPEDTAAACWRLIALLEKTVALPL